MKVSSKKAAHLVIKVPRLAHKNRGRGNHDHQAWRDNQFKKGHSGNPGGKPQVYVKFKTKIAEQMMEPAPPAVKKALKLKRGATMYDAMVAALVHNAANGDNSAFMNCHDIVDGPVIQKHFNLTASMERFLEDPKFREFLEQQHGEYLNQIGVTDGTEGPRIPASSSLHRLFGDGGPED
jgi:hypothetical protein